MIRWVPVLGTSVAVVMLASAVPVLASGTMQKAPSGTMQKAPSGVTAPAMKVQPVGDLEVVGFSVTPNEFHDPMRRDGQSWVHIGMPMVLNATIKNKGSASTNSVAWKIVVRNGTAQPWPIGSGTITRIEPGAPASINLSYGYIFWAANNPEGDYPFVLTVESPDEPAARKGSENSRTVVVKVHATKIATRWITYSLMNAKGGASVSVDTSGGGCSRDTSSGGLDAPQFKLDCKNRLFGGRLWAEYLNGVQLKNGWVVTFTDLQTRSDPSDWTLNSRANGAWETRPSGTSVHTKVRLAVEAGGFVTGSIDVRVEGPEHADPFQ